MCLYEHMASHYFDQVGCGDTHHIFRGPVEILRTYTSHTSDHLQASTLLQVEGFTDYAGSVFPEDHAVYFGHK